MKTMLRIITLLSFVLAVSATAQAHEKPSIDLSKGTLNGRVFTTLTIAKI
jgi:hypothetical protein